MREFFARICTSIPGFQSSPIDDPWGILRWIGQRHPPDQRPHVLGHCSSPWLPTLTQSCPMIPERLRCQAMTGAELDNEQRVLPACPEAGESGPAQAIRRTQAGSLPARGGAPGGRPPGAAMRYPPPREIESRHPPALRKGSTGNPFGACVSGSRALCSQYHPSPPQPQAVRSTWCFSMA